MKKIFLIVSVTILSLSPAFADGILTSWGMKDLKGMTQERFEAAKTWSVPEILQNNLTAKTWPDVYLLAVAADQKKDSIVDDLISQLEVSSTSKLELTSRLIIWERILLGDILFEGKGLQINDDLFSVAGRANWILRNLTKKTFGFVKPNSTSGDLQELKSKWKQWREGKTVAEYVDPYESTEKALTELHSLVALEALIYSLKPSPEKALLTKDCLKRIYGLEELPKDKGVPANYCSPDTYTYLYVGRLAGVKFDETKNYEWWAKWWNENKSKLTWNKEKAIFEVSR